jgi:hypothetical protein
MRTIREILLTEYIGAILVAALIADAFAALITTTITQAAYYVQSRHDQFANVHRMSPIYAALEALCRIVFYLSIAYLIAHWLYPAGITAVRHTDKPAQNTSPTTL